MIKPNIKALSAKEIVSLQLELDSVARGGSERDLRKVSERLRGEWSEGRLTLDQIESMALKAYAVSGTRVSR